MTDLSGYAEIKARHTGNGRAAPDPLHLIPFEVMQPRLGDGYLIKHLLGSTAMAVLYGESGSGKTFFALHLAMCVAAGTEFFGRRVREAGVVYVAAEAGRGIENRVVAVKLSRRFPKTMPFAAITTAINLCTDTADLERLIAAINGADIGAAVELIVIDTLSRVMAGGNENQPDDMGALVRNLDRLRSETGAAVIVVHHTGKDTSRGARGHSLLRASTDTEIEITRDETTKVCTARVTKQREYATDGTLSFSLRQIELGTDQDDEAVTSCVIEAVEGAATPQRKPAKLTGGAKVGYEQLKNCMADSATDIPPSNHVPKGAKDVTLDQWKNFLEKAGVINPEGNPREQFKRIRVTLQSGGYIGVWSDFVWLSHAVTKPSQ
jgi:energy-coupling factor transporter ATP-binding protein EcfA2